MKERTNGEELFKYCSFLKYIFTGKLTHDSCFNSSLTIFRVFTDPCALVRMFSVLLYCSFVPFSLWLISIILPSILCFWQFQLWIFSCPSQILYLLQPQILFTTSPIPLTPDWQYSPLPKDPFKWQQGLSCHWCPLKWLVTILLFSTGLTGILWLSTSLCGIFSLWTHELHELSLILPYCSTSLFLRVSLFLAFTLSHC